MTFIMKYVHYASDTYIMNNLTQTEKCTSFLFKNEILILNDSKRSTILK